MTSASKSVFDFTTGRVGITLPQLGAGIAVLFLGFIAYTELATKKYVDDKHEDVTGKISALADAQAATGVQMATLAQQNEKTDQRMGLIVRLVSAQYVEHVDDQEGVTPPGRRRRTHRSTKANAVAKALNIDPDDPLAGLELTEVLDQ